MRHAASLPPRRFLALAVLLFVGISCGKDSPSGPDETGFTPTPGVSLVLSDAAAPPLQLITATVRGASVPASGILARMGDIEMGAERMDDSTIVFFPPAAAAQAYQIQVEFGTTRLQASFQLQAVPLTVNSDAYITSTMDALDELVESGTWGDDAARETALAELAEARAALAAASAEDRAAAAAFFAANVSALGISVPGGPSAAHAALFANAAVQCSCTDGSAPRDRYEACNAQLGSYLNTVLGKALTAGGILIAARAGGRVKAYPVLIASVAAVALVAGVITNIHIEAWCKFLDPAFDKVDSFFDARAEASGATGGARLVAADVPAASLREGGVFIADTARRLDVMGTYSTPSLALAERNGLVAGAVAQMSRFGEIYADIRSTLLFLPPFGEIPATSASSLQSRIPADYLILTGGTPGSLGKSYAVADDSIFMATFTLPTIGNDHAITFDAEYAGPGMITDEKATYTATLKPAIYPVATIVLDPSVDMIDVETDKNVGITATLRDSLDRILTDRPVTWTSSQPSVATVSGSGLTATVYGVREGLSTIRATAETRSADFIVKVGPMPVDTIDIIPDTVSIGLGGTMTLQAETRDSLGNILGGRLVEWSSSNTGHVTVSETGLIEGVALGEATITAVSEGRTNTAFVRVVAGAVALGTGASANHFCALATGGALFCWGSNSDGQLGDGTATDRSVPTYAGAIPNGLVQVVTGREHSCALDGDGAAMCWGANDLGQLGDGTIGGAKFAMVAGGHTFTKLAIGRYNTCGIATTGTTYCWGQRVTGTATTTEQPTPLAVSGSYVDLVGAPHGGACGLTAGGAMYCWGAIGWGPTAASQFPVSPTRFGGTMTFSRIVAGYHHQCGLSNGTAWCWGSQMEGVAGDTLSYIDPETGEVEDVRVPVRVYNAPALVSLTAGENWTCGLTSTGAAWCWAGVHGLPVLTGGPSGTTTPTRGAITGAAPLRFTQLTAARQTACGMDSGGIVYCWGENTSGQAGQGTFTPLPGVIPPRPVEEPVTP